MSAYFDSLREVYPQIMKDMLSPEDQQLVEGFQQDVSKRIANEVKKFSDSLNQRLQDFQQRDFAAEFAKAIEADQRALADQLARIETKIADIEKAAERLDKPVVLDYAKDSVAAIKTAVDGLHKTIDDAKAKVGTLSTKLSTTAGGIVRTAVLGLIGGA